MKRHRTSQESLERDKRHAASITRVLSIYGYITDSYIIEFFTDHLWESLPESWRVVLSDLPAPQLADQLLCNGNSAEVRYSSVWPLSLLALKVTAHSLAFQRTPRYEKISGLQKRPAEFQHNHSQSSRLDPLFRKHVKPKKQHEIRQLGKLVKKLCDSTSCADVVDVGSGQGHLSRVLAFGLGLCVTAVEADDHLVTMAAKFDQEMIYMLKKEKLRPAKNGGTEATSIPFPKPPRHVLACVDPQAPWEDFVRQVASNAEETSLQSAGENKMADDTWRTLTNASTSHVTTSTEEVMNLKTTRENEAAEPSAGSCHVVSESRVDRRFLLTGLHACGDLSVAMLRHFARCPGVAGITSVACCYMKLTTLEVPQPPGVLSADSDIREFGYPMSSWVSRLSGHKLSYKSREVACHAIEDYIARLKGDSDILRTHCYRAMLETVIRKVDPTMRRPGVQTIKKAHRLPFTEYAMLGLERVGLDPNTPLDETSVEHMLSQQQNVVVFFSLALLLAPLVETLILLDRMIFLRERGFQCEVIPLFKPQFSARNLVLVAAKDISDLGDLLEETTASESAM
ncbi:protein RRNAD1 isoform X1 [Rana temporaria]|uniref:protein RRNAD1 isoform X1 n=1 Tax=Rana temporaria TaxID=8407 RepID=UPI001AAC7729|nr:protein RRNAD1 isoform X1 [Rana temporaria]XP_040211128.1 protein RRNAD1 isoform X1 [Rana temporaria]